MNHFSPDYLTITLEMYNGQKYSRFSTVNSIRYCILKWSDKKRECLCRCPVVNHVLLDSLKDGNSKEICILDAVKDGPGWYPKKMCLFEPKCFLPH